VKIRFCDFCSAHTVDSDPTWMRITVTLGNDRDAFFHEPSVEADSCPQCRPLLNDLRYVLRAGVMRAREQPPPRVPETFIREVSDVLIRESAP
jgi:hypothetical protein